MQLELNLIQLKKSGMQIGTKGFQNLLVTMGLEKKPLKKWKEKK